MIVVDTNLIAYFFIHGEHSDITEKAFQKDPQWAESLLWQSEFRNVLVKCLKDRYFKFEDAVQIIGEAEGLMTDGGRLGDDLYKNSTPFRTIRAVASVRKALWNGFTAMRDVGSEGAMYADVDVKKAIDEGLIQGPQLQVSISMAAEEKSEYI